jgi:hypothetical protein
MRLISQCRSCGGFPHQPRWAVDEDHCDDQRGEDFRECRREEDRDDAVCHANEDRGDDGSRQGAEAANYYNDKGQEERVVAHEVMRLLDGNDKDCTYGGKARTKAENDGIDGFDGDAESLRHVAVLLRGAHDQASACAGDREPERDEDYGGGGNNEEFVGCRGQAPWIVHRKAVFAPFEPRKCDAAVERWFNGASIGAEGHQGGLLENIKRADGGDDRAFGIIVDAAQDQAINTCGEGSNDEGCDHERGNKTERGVAADGGCDEPSKDRTEHVKFAVGHVYNAHNAKHDGQPHRGEGEHGSGDAAFEDSQQEVGAKIHEFAFRGMSRKRPTQRGESRGGLWQFYTKA